MKEKNIEKRARIETFEYLDQILFYDSETGLLFWKKLFPGKIAGTAIQGVIKVALERLDFKAHRLCWILFYGKAPAEGMVIDHINGDPHDNRISNLRECMQAENSRNAKKPKNNTTGYKGVSWSPRTIMKYRAYICVDRRQIHLGLYPTAELAHAAYLKAAKEHFGEFACLDR